MEYCSWNPFTMHKKTLMIDQSGRVQIFFTRCLPSLKLYSYSERLTILKLEFLNLGRLKADLTMQQKILNGFDWLGSCNVLFYLNRNVKNTRTNGMIFVKPTSKSSLHSNFQVFLTRPRLGHRYLNCWNVLHAIRCFILDSRFRFFSNIKLINV